MNQIDRQKFDEYEASRALARFRTLVRSCCAPIWWETGGATVLGNASMCIVSTTAGLFSVTNNHVLTVYEKHKAEDPGVFCQFGGAPFDPVQNLIARSDYWDLATFRIPHLTLEHCGCEKWVADTWPPRAIQRDDAVVVGGYPENRRSTTPEPKPAQLSNDFVSLIARAENWSDEHMSFCSDSGSWYWPQGIALPPHPDLSGMSGGPCFRIIPEEGRIELAGFVYEAHSNYEVIRVRQASLISADGQIASRPLGSMRAREG